MKRSKDEMTFAKRMRNRIAFLKENDKQLWLIIVIVSIDVICVLLSTLLLKFLPENRDRSFWETIKFAFTLMVNPSGRYIYSDYSVSLIITTCVVLIGMISLTAGTVGYITTFFSNFLQESKKNIGTLYVQNHIVILNYNKMVPYILYDYCYDDKKNTYVVILSDVEEDKIKNDLANLYNEMSISPNRRFKNIVIRIGNPMSGKDLDAIRLKESQSVILVRPDNDTSSDRDIQSYDECRQYFYIQKYLGDGPDRPHVVFETNDERSDMHIAIDRKANIDDSDDYTSINANSNEIIGKLLAVIALMPSLRETLLQLFSFKGVETYTDLITENNSIQSDLQTSQSSLPLFDIKHGNKTFRAYIAEDIDELHKKRHVVSQKSRETTLPDKIEIDQKILFTTDYLVILDANDSLKFFLDSLLNFSDEYSDMSGKVILAGTKESEKTMDELYSVKKYHKLFSQKDDNGKYIVIQSPFSVMDDLIKIISPDKKITFLALSNDDYNISGLKTLMYWNNIRNFYNRCNTFGFDAGEYLFIADLRDSRNETFFKNEPNCISIKRLDVLGGLFAQLSKNTNRIDVINSIIDHNKDITLSGFCDEMDLLSIDATQITGDKASLEFESIREFVLWMFNATDSIYIPLGIVRKVTIKNRKNENKNITVDKTFLFSRVTKFNDSLDNTKLYDSDDYCMYDYEGNGMKNIFKLYNDDDTFSVLKDDKIIVAKKCTIE